MPPGEAERSRTGTTTLVIVSKRHPTRLPRAVTQEAPRLRLAKEHGHCRWRIDASLAAVMAVQAYELAKVGSNECCGTG